VVSTMQAMGSRAKAIKADLTKKADVDATVQMALDTFGKIDSLVHVSGGLIARKKITEMDLMHWNKVLEVNLTSLFLMSNAVIPHLKSGSSIVTFASQAARDGGGGGSVAYATSKGAVTTFTRGLAKELGPDIRVNCVCPGMINTKFHDDFTSDDIRAKVAAGVPLQREGKADEIAKLVTFLTSSDSSYMTGTNIDINGGGVFS